MLEDKDPQGFIDSLATVPGKFSDRAKLTVTATSEALQITPRQVRLILESGVLPDLRSDRIVRLSRKKVYVPRDGTQPILRTRSESTDPDSGRPIGYSASMTDDDVLAASRMWWRADPSKIVNAGYLLVSVGSLIVAILAVDGVDSSVRVEVPGKNGETGNEVRHSFNARLVSRYEGVTDSVIWVGADTTPFEYAISEALLGHFHRAVSGGPIAYL